MTTSQSTLEAIEPFRIDVPQADLDDLSARLAATRWPGEVAKAGTAYGMPLEVVQRLARRWQDGYDWRAQEARLNEIPQFSTDIDGTSVHFLHVRSPEPDARPLLLLHGWPGSVVEFLGLIGPLTDPRGHGLDPSVAFDVVVPSLPGYGFSGPTTETGWDSARMARAFATLMGRLGGQRWGMSGGGAGALVARGPGRQRWAPALPPPPAGLGPRPPRPGRGGGTSPPTLAAPGVQAHRAG